MYWDIQAEKEQITVVIHGVVDFEQVEDFRRLLEKQVLKKRKIILDLARCQELCSMAVGIVLGFKIESRLNGGDLCIINPHDRIKEIFTIVGADAIFDELCPADNS